MESQEDNSLFFIIGYRLKGWISARIVGCLSSGRNKVQLFPYLLWLTFEDGMFKWKRVA
jgi:hypothetical protein